MDKNKFADLIISSTDSLYRVARTILTNDADAEDAVGEAVLKGFSRLETLKNDKYAKTWLTRILINECYNILRSKEADADFSEAEDRARAEERPGPDLAAAESDLYYAMRKLPGEQRMAIVLFYFEGCSIRDISDITGARTGTVKSRLSRGRQRLRELLEDDYEKTDNR